LGLEPAACLVVEDSANGLTAAAAAGMACVVIPCGTTTSQNFARAKGRLASLEDLPAWLSRGQRHEPGLRTARSSW
jgi:beta-phosphoglucomutase-like phosphatase (HAD superfamily)